MAKEKTVHICQNCGHQTPKFLGKCPECQQWGTFVEEKIAPPAKNPRGMTTNLFTASEPVPITKVDSIQTSRYLTGSDEFNRVLGGGLVKGSIVLLAGPPGSGKTTLAGQIMNFHANELGTVLYITGEESQQQTKLRADRIGITSDNFLILAETCLEKIIGWINKYKPSVIVIDSVQTIYSEALESSPGSVSQIKEATGQLMMLAKHTGISIYITAQITKDGSIAGPKVLEHMVDVVLYFEGAESGTPYRIVRAFKNRFGATNEIGCYSMHETGLVDVPNPSELFLAERPVNTAGSAVVATIEGTRPLLVEIQGLVSQSNLGTPRRTSLGVDSNRLSLLIAVLEKKVGLQMGGNDIFLNVAGGVKLVEPAVDLGTVFAVASSFMNRTIPQNLIVMGEVGLTGEIRTVSQPETRIKEAAKLGFGRIILPENNLKHLKNMKDVELIGVTTVEKALEYLEAA